MDKKFIQISIIVFFLTLLIGNKVIYQPKRQMVQKLNREKAKLLERAELLDEINQIRRRKDYYKQGMFPEQKMSLLLDEIINIAKRTEIKLDSITPQPLVKYGIYTRMPIEITAQCSYHELAKFISNLESSRQFIRLDKLDLTAKPKYGEEEKVTPRVRLLVSTVYME